MPDPQGLAFDELAEDYDLGRPPWPLEMLDGIDGAAALDLAAGTGKLTSLLVERFAAAVAVEPLEGMRAVLRHNAPAARVVDGSAEEVPLEDASVDAAFVAEAFHWFDSVTAVAELARVLRPGGTLLVCFNDWRSLEPELPAEVEDVLRDAWHGLPPPGGPKVQTGAWKEGFAGLPFGALDERGFVHEWPTDAESIAAYYVSTSSMASMPAGDRAALRTQLLELIPDVAYRFVIEARTYRAVRA